MDTHGALVGINTAIVAKSLGVEGIGFAIPVNMVRGVLDEIVARGRVVRGWIGIVPQDITEQQAAQFGLARSRGAAHQSLRGQVPALKAGLRPGDMLLEIDGTPVQSARDAIARVAAHKPGTYVTLQRAAQRRDRSRHALRSPRGLAISESQALRHSDRRWMRRWPRRLKAALEQDGGAVMLSGGNTPRPAFAKLGAERLHPGRGFALLYSDERYVPANSRRATIALHYLWSPLCAFPSTGTLRVRTELPCPMRQTTTIAVFRSCCQPTVRSLWACSGLGADGHTASLFSPADLERARGRLAIAVDRPDGMQAISVTPALLQRVEHVLFVVTGQDKRAALTAFLARDPKLVAWRAVANCADVEVWIEGVDV